MTMRSLVIGMGIGQLYKSVLSDLGFDVTTVDSDIAKGANFPTVESAILAYGPFDTAHICTPNFTHAKIARQIAPYTKMVFIEKPGVSTSAVWCNLILENPNTRFMMVKNNMWRSNIDELKSLADKAKTVNLNWINKDRVPNPGTWFTTRELSFGGVSRDLMPHLISLYIALNPNWQHEAVNGQGSLMRWQLKDLTTTDYGRVQTDGVYNVDDKCHINFGNKWQLTADWRDMQSDKRNIEFIMQDNSVEIFELGLCPEDAYSRMIKDAVENYNNIQFWDTQLSQDIFIHQKVETL